MAEKDSWTHVVVTAYVKITLKSYNAIVDIEKDTII